MPLYDYSCPDCGPFRAWTRMSEAEAPGRCPECGQRAQRSVAMPFLAMMNANTRIAHARNERSAHEPRVMSKQELDASGRKRSEVFGDNRHRLNHYGCGHDHGHAGKGKFRRAHNSTRPWMMGH
jgi:putative FmdB family regulatory protein